MNDWLSKLAKYKSRYDKLMEGRHGVDSLSRDLFVLWIILGFFNGFVRSKILMLLSLMLPLFSCLRVFSTNSVRRSAECRKYLELRSGCAEFFKITKRRFDDRKTHKYYKCKNCSAYLRVKKKPGSHVVACPKCGKELHVKIRGRVH